MYTDQTQADSFIQSLCQTSKGSTKRWITYSEVVRNTVYKKTLNELYVNSYLGFFFFRKNVYEFMKQITQYNLSFPGFARYC